MINIHFNILFSLSDRVLERVKVSVKSQISHLKIALGVLS